MCFLRIQPWLYSAIKIHPDENGCFPSNFDCDISFNSSTSSSSDIPTPSGTATTSSDIVWDDMGPHQENDLTIPSAGRDLSYNFLLKLKFNKWFMPHYMTKYKSLGHQLLSVSSTQNIIILWHFRYCSL